MTSEAGRSYETGRREMNDRVSKAGDRTPGSSGGASATDSAREAISGAATQAGAKVVSGLNSQKAKAADGLGCVAQALRRSGEQLRTQDPSTPVQHYVSSAADQVERLSGYLRESSVSDMVNGLEQFARRQPALFIGGAFMLGLLGARFLKSSGRSDTSSDASRPARDVTARRNPDYVDPRTTAGYWREQQARSAIRDDTDVGGSPTGGEVF
jgi:hypothetical protein